MNEEVWADARDEETWSFRGNFQKEGKDVVRWENIGYVEIGKSLRVEKWIFIILNL